MIIDNDLAPTFAGWTGATPLLSVDGRSLTPLLTPTPQARWRTAFLAEGARHESIGRPAYRAVRTHNYLYVRYFNGEKELYNLQRDPYELRSYDEGADPALKERLGRRISALDSCKGSEGPGSCGAAEGP